MPTHLLVYSFFLVSSFFQYSSLLHTQTYIQYMWQSTHMLNIHCITGTVCGQVAHLTGRQKVATHTHIHIYVYGIGGVRLLGLKHRGQPWSGKRPRTLLCGLGLGLVLASTLSSLRLVLISGGAVGFSWWSLITRVCVVTHCTFTQCTITFHVHEILAI